MTDLVERVALALSDIRVCDGFERPQPILCRAKKNASAGNLPTLLSASCWRKRSRQRMPKARQ